MAGPLATAHVSVSALLQASCVTLVKSFSLYVLQFHLQNGGNSLSLLLCLNTLMTVEWADAMVTRPYKNFRSITTGVLGSHVICLVGESF